MEKRKFGWPLLLIAIGIIFLLKNLGFIDLNFYELLFSWPMILVAIGVVQLVDRSYVSGFILLFLGTVFMLPRLDIIQYDAMRVFWPVVLIVIGTALLFRRRGISYAASADRYRASAASTSPDADGFVRIDTSFSGSKTLFTEPVFRGAILRSTFGGIELDLRSAEKIPQGCLKFPMLCPHIRQPTRLPNIANLRNVLLHRRHRRPRHHDAHVLPPLYFYLTTM